MNAWQPDGHTMLDRPWTQEEQARVDATPRPRLAILDEIPVPDVPLDEQRHLAAMMADALPEPITSLADALDAAHGYVTRYVACPSPHEPVAIVLWIGHAWAVDAAETSPYLAATSPEKRSGKTRLLEAVGQLVPRPWSVLNPSEAVLYRKLEADRPTLLLDEVDAIFAVRRSAENHEGLRALLNAGNRRGTMVPRCVGEGRKMVVKDFAIFGPKIVAGIGALPETVADRSIPIRLERRSRTEVVERFRIREAGEAAAPIRDALRDILEPLVGRLADARPAIPGALGDRAADSWEPLLAIADAAGGTWPARARAAAIALSGETSNDLDDASLSVLLLADTRTIFAGRAVDRLTSSQLVSDLAADAERPWATYRSDKPITAHGMARLLRHYGIRVGRHKFGGIVERGYLASDFMDAWSRYLPAPETPSDRQPVNPETPRTNLPARESEPSENPAHTDSHAQNGAAPVDELTVGGLFGEADGPPLWDPEYATDDEAELWQ